MIGNYGALRILAFVALTWPPTLALTTEHVRRGDDQLAVVVNKVVESVNAHYVLIDKRAEISDFLTTQLASHRYDSLNNVELAASLTKDMRKISNDKHMRVQFSPERYAALAQEQSESELAEEVHYWTQQAIKNHFGIADVRQLDDNIGYLRLSSFWAGDVAYRYMNSALALLRHDDALIFDLRKNKGGESEMVTYLISVLLNDSEPRLLGTMFDGMRGETVQEYSVTGLAELSLAGKPLYVLIDDKTYSAGEAFAQHVRNFRIGTLVGQTTAGAAHTVELLPVGGGFVLALPTGRVEHALTGKDWERVGVQPHVVTEADEALRTAHDLARRAIARD